MLLAACQNDESGLVPENGAKLNIVKNKITVEEFFTKYKLDTENTIFEGIAIKGQLELSNKSTTTVAEITIDSENVVEIITDGNKTYTFPVLHGTTD